MDIKIKIAIASNKNFQEKTIPIILKSLLDNNIKKDDIVVFIAGHDYTDEDTIDNIKYRYLDFNSFEYSPLIDIVENNLESEYWFLIHDTCKVGNNFKNLLYNIPYNKPQKIALKDSPSMSIGLYSYEYLKSVQNKLLDIKNKDYSNNSINFWKNWGVPNEDYILWKTLPSPEIYNNNLNWEVLDYKNWYGTDTTRRTEYYYSLDIYKNKSNWGQTFNNMVIDI
jgi:hypothetical protein